MLTAEARERALGGRLGVYDVEIRNQKGETVALFRGRSYAVSATVIRDGGSLP